ncbi:GGDEF domain-containing protein [Shewanella algae]|uniref:GGDEF domain-containing protein n=1 Tax=Shewanella algae TaxID=38313 RepID=UPI001BEE0B41|nr:GGDEF domain-containing protein [Shewanella algae]BCV50963.1 GGDEF domain-containing protein [Shewanella algae]
MKKRFCPPLIAIFMVLASPTLLAANAEQFSRLLKGAESQLYSLPQRAQAQLYEMEGDQLKDLPKPLVTRFYLTKATVSLLLHEVPAAEQAAKEGLKLADAGTSEHTLLELRLVQVMLQTGKVKQAISELQKIIDRNQNSADKAVQAEALLLKSKAFEQQGKLDASYASLMLSLDAADQSQDKELLERISFGMGHLLVRLNGFERSEKLLKKAFNFFKDRRMSYNQMLVQLDLAQLAERQGKAEVAIDRYQAALELARVLGYGLYRFRINVELALKYRELEDVSSMSRHLQLADNLQYRETSTLYTSRFQLLKAQDLLNKHQYAEMAVYVDPLLIGFAKEQTLLRSQIELLKVSAEGFAGLGNFKRAYEVLEQYQQRFAAYSSKELVSNLDRQQLLFNLERLEFENQDLNWNNVLQKLELETNRTTLNQLNIISSIILLLLLLATAVILWLNRSRLKWGLLAKTDSLTGLYNRRYLAGWLLYHQATEEQNLEAQPKWRMWLDRLKEVLLPTKAQSSHGPLALITLDIDHFKKVNDTHGHNNGDRVLTELAKVMKTSLREDDLLARVGGEEFMLLLPDTGLNDAVAVAETLRQSVAEHIFTLTDGEPLRLTVSQGVALDADGSQSFSQLTDTADKLLYQAKQLGRNRVESRLAPGSEAAAV